MYTHAHMQRGEDKGEGASVFTGQPKSTNHGVSLERMIDPHLPFFILSGVYSALFPLEGRQEKKEEKAASNHLDSVVMQL